MIARLRLAKTPLCLLIGMSVLFGAILATPILSQEIILVALGVTVIAAGAATCNSMQERSPDSQMARTKSRPLPAGVLNTNQAATQTVLLFGAGFLLLAFGKSMNALLLVIVAIFFYNGLYTPLKQYTHLAIVPGALCGALPPYIGWVAANGEMISYTALLLVSLFLLWQVPHFWLVLLRYREDYLVTTQPNLLQQLREKTIRRMLLPWLCGLMIVMLLFTVLPYPLQFFAKCVITANAFSLPVLFSLLLRFEKEKGYQSLFILINSSLLMHMLLVSMGRLLH